MKNVKFYISGLLITLITISCTKVIDLNLGNDTGKLVIEGNITNLPGTHYIKLSQNVSFTNTNTYPAVTGATITVTDQAGNIYKLPEGPAGTYSINQFAGMSGNTYTMNVLTNGKNYTASSTMPDVVVLDSITPKSNEFNRNNKEVTVHFKDPAGVPNQYRFVMYVNDVQVKSVFAMNDDFTDGRYVNLDLNQNDIDMKAGDKVTVEMQCIDKPVYTYWYTLSRQQANGPGGGVTPTNPPNNITNNALGYFSAHTSQSKMIIVK